VGRRLLTEAAVPGSLEGETREAENGKRQRLAVLMEHPTEDARCKERGVDGM